MMPMTSVDNGVMVMERSAQQGKVVLDLRVVLMMVDWGPMGGGGWKREVATKRAHVAIVHRESKNKWIECIPMLVHTQKMPSLLQINLRDGSYPPT